MEIQSSNEQKCEEMYKVYHAKFPDVQTLTSKELLSTPSKYWSPHYLIVDVRSRPEQKVSMIPGSITLDEFEARMATTYTQQHSDPKSHDRRDEITTSSLPTIVTYCTIGYRSGLEARKIRDNYGVDVLNLDGIVNYTHAVMAYQDSKPKNSIASDHDGTLQLPDPSLIDPKTQSQTKKVHVFGVAWDVGHERFEATYFSKPAMALRGAGVMVRSALSFLIPIFTCGCKKSRLKDA